MFPSQRKKAAVARRQMFAFEALSRGVMMVDGARDQPTIREAHTLDHWNQRLDGEEGCAVLHFFGDDASTPTTDNRIHFSQDLRYPMSVASERNNVLPVAWISHEYIASIRRGDQARNACRQASFIVEMV